MAGNTSRQNGKLGGRPKGSTSNSFRQAFQEAFGNGERLEVLIDQTWNHLEKGDKEMLKYTWDQLAGKAKQTVEGDFNAELFQYVISRGNQEDNSVDTTQSTGGDTE